MRISGSEAKSKIFFSSMFVLFFFIAASVMPYVSESFHSRQISATPDLLFALSIVCGIVYENRKAASVIALVAGVICDIFMTPPIHFSPLMFFLGAYFASKTIGVFTAENASTAAVASIPFFLARTVISTLYILSEDKDAHLAEILKTTALPELALNVVSVFFIYVIVNFLYKRFKRRFYM